MFYAISLYREKVGQWSARLIRLSSEPYIDTYGTYSTILFSQYEPESDPWDPSIPSKCGLILLEVIQFRNDTTGNMWIIDNSQGLKYLGVGTELYMVRNVNLRFPDWIVTRNDTVAVRMFFCFSWLGRISQLLELYRKKIYSNPSEVSELGETHAQVVTVTMELFQDAMRHRTVTPATYYRRHNY